MEVAIDMPAPAEKVEADEDFGLSDEEVVRRALLSFEMIDENIYPTGREMHAARRDIVPCDCSFVPGKDPIAKACGPECINRVLFIECIRKECPCGEFCTNRQFQKKEYSRVNLVRTPLKGCGLRAATDIPSGGFIMEYCGEVLTHSAFHARKKRYTRENKRHFYFMSLNADEVIDATVRGTLSRFINHSCEPNCITQKWLVDGELRIGIFTTARIREGEELTFDYKFERYGGKPQVCHCGTPSCKGFIGVQKKAAVMKAAEKEVDEEAQHSSEEEEEEEEEDEQSINESVNALPINETDQLLPVVRQLVQFSRPEQVFRQLERIKTTTNPQVLSRFLHLQGLTLVAAWLVEHRDNTLLRRSILELLLRLTITERSSQVDRIESSVKKLVDDPSVGPLAQQLLDSWTTLEAAYRIPKRAAPEPVSPAPTPTTPSTPSTPSFSSSGTRPSDMSAHRRTSFSNSPHSNTSSPYRSGSFGNNGNNGSFGSNSGNNGSFGNNSGNNGSFASNSGNNGSFGNNNNGSNNGSFNSQYRGDFPRNDYSRNDRRGSNGYESNQFPSFNRGDSNNPMPLADPNAVAFAAAAAAAAAAASAAPVLPPDWRTATAPNGTTYYYHVHTKQTQWEPPAMPAALPLAALGITTDAVAGASSLGGGEKRSHDGFEEEVGSDVEEAGKGGEGKAARSSDEAARKRRKELEHTPEYRAFREGLSQCVLSTMSKHKEGMDAERFKHFARKITHSILDREFKGKEEAPVWSDERKVKVVKFVQEYLKHIGVIAKDSGSSKSSKPGSSSGSKKHKEKK